MKIAKRATTGDAVAVPCTIYKVIVTGTVAGNNVIVQDSTTELFRVYILANTTEVVDLSNTPITCATKCTLTIAAGGGVTEVSVIYQEWSL